MTDSTATHDMPGADQERHALANPAYRRDLGDGLTLRWSTSADADRLARFYGQVFREREQDPPNLRAMAWTRDMISGRHPLIGPDGFALVEHTATGEVVAATCLLSEAWEVDGVRLPVGRPEIVGSLPDYRRRGLVREVMRLIHARSHALGHVAEVITGIAWYYRQFGYEYTVEFERGARIAAADIPAVKEGEPEPITLRPATESDIPVIARLYDEERASALVSTPIDERYWRWAVVESDPHGDSFLRVFMVDDAGGEAIGYVMTGMSVWRGGLSIFGLWLRPGAWLGVFPALLRGVSRIGEATTVSPSGGATPFRALRFYLPQGHPALVTLPTVMNAEPLDEAYAWYVRVSDLPALLRLLAPALERRLAASPFAGYTGDLALDFYRGGVRMTWREGKLAEVADWVKPVWGEGNAGFPPGVFLQLLFGYRDIGELHHVFPDVWAEGAAKALLPTLFPRRESWALPLG
ncbi:MAG TPA: GNAT family N-acetyltransferase [Ktedonobacterales bacterium]